MTCHATPAEIAAIAAEGASQPVRKVAGGALMLKRGDVIGVLRKRIGKAHEEADRLAEGGDIAVHAIVRRVIAAYFDVLADVTALPEFENPSPVGERLP